jgi:hypothetical protein
MESVFDYKINNEGGYYKLGIYDATKMYVSRSPSIIYFVSDKKIFNNILIDQ